MFTKAEKIKLIVLDVDGTMTDGTIYLDNNGIETKGFNVKDGFAIANAIKEGINVAIITGRKSRLVEKRAEELGIQYVFQGIHNKEIEAKDKEISRLNTLLEKALCWFPLLKEMLRMEKLCYVTGFTKGMVDSLLYKKEALRCSGKIYSEEYRQRFETKNVIFKIERSPINKNKLMLTINQQPISEWFKEQWEKLQQHLRNSVQKEQKSRGFRM